MFQPLLAELAGPLQTSNDNRLCCGSDADTEVMPCTAEKTFDLGPGWHDCHG